MRIYKLAQVNWQTLTPDKLQSAMKALQTIMQTVAVVNSALKDIEQNNVAQLMQKDTLINAILSGDAAQINVNIVNKALQDMSNIAQAMPILNNAVATIQNLGLGNTISQKMIVDALNSGNNNQLEGLVTGFQSQMNMLSGATGNLKGMGFLG